MNGLVLKVSHSFFYKKALRKKALRKKALCAVLLNCDATIRVTWFVRRGWQNARNQCEPRIEHCRYHLLRVATERVPQNTPCRRKHPAVEEKEGHQARLSDMYINCGLASVKRCARPQPQHSLNSKLFHNMYNTSSTFPFCSCTVLRPAHNPFFFYLFLLL